MSEISLCSPAKLNLFLKILKRRKDGYHDIVTLFERINLCDHVSLEALSQNKILFECDHPDVPSGAENIMVKAALLLKKDFNISRGVRMRLTKRIPVAAGLAGGSSNAAVTLIGLNQIWNLRLSQKILISYAAQLGSDVAFFLYDSSWAVGTERGQKIKILSLSSKLWHILVIPAVKLYSYQIYEAFDKIPTNILTKSKDDVNILIQHLKRGSLVPLSSLLMNDLEEAVFRACPRLLYLKEKLNSFKNDGVLISGSGPAIFTMTETETQAREIESVLKKDSLLKDTQIFVVRTF